MKILVVFYSRTGNTKKIAEELSKRFNADLDEITPACHYEGIVGYVRAGFQSARNKHPKIKNSKNPALYDLVLIGSPVWASTLASPVASYISKNKFKKVAFFFTKGGSNLKLKTKLKPISRLEVTEKEIKEGSYSKKLDGFVKKVKEASS